MMSSLVSTDDILTAEDYMEIADKVSRSAIAAWWAREDIASFVVMRLWETQPKTSPLAWVIAKRARADWFEQDGAWARRHKRAIERGTIVEIPTSESVEIEVLGKITVEEIIDEYMQDELKRIKYIKPESRIPPERTHSILEMFSDGYRRGDIVDIMDMHKTTVQNIARRLGELTEQ